MVNHCFKKSYAVDVEGLNKNERLYLFVIHFQNNNKFFKKYINFNKKNYTIF